MSNPVINWASENPVAAGVAGIGVVVVVLFLMGGSGSSSGDGGAAVSAYYNAVAQQNQAGNMVQIAQIQAQAGTNQALIAASYGVEHDKIWANNATELAKINAPVEQAAINANLTLQSKALDYNYGYATNQIALENARLTQQQNIAFKQINAQKKSWFESLVDGVVKIAPIAAAPFTGGTSLIGAGASAVKLPSLGSPGQWV